MPSSIITHQKDASAQKDVNFFVFCCFCPQPLLPMLLLHLPLHRHRQQLVGARFKRGDAKKRRTERARVGAVGRLRGPDTPAKEHGRRGGADKKTRSHWLWVDTDFRAIVKMDTIGNIEELAKKGQQTRVNE
ncbi:unnamed protein product [Caenorhabditis bovis]|uniref:Uncharacterized protein n=1 Tax=Caenorhabditis bovis TaxID=2654633 RepID=A0A8S1F8J4_9PELO|nr:unnamed protein product [Caenorhabditis bovis]